MSKDNVRSIVVASQGGARLLRLESMALGRQRLAVVDTIGNPWEEHQHGRPSPRAAKNGHTNASTGHEDDEMASRFARDVASWLQKKVETRDVDRVDLFAPPQFLGDFRKAASPQLASHLVEHVADLTKLEPSALVSHPALADLVRNGGRPDRFM